MTTDQYKIKSQEAALRCALEALERAERIEIAAREDAKKDGCHPMSAERCACRENLKVYRASLLEVRKALIL